MPAATEGFKNTLKYEDIIMYFFGKTRLCASAPLSSYSPFSRISLSSQDGFISRINSLVRLR